MKTKRLKRCDKKIILSDQLALRELRLELDLTLEEAGKKLGLSAKGIGAIENGRVSLARKRITEIITSYGLDYLDFVRAKRIIEKALRKNKKGKRQTIKKVLKNSDRRSYQKLVTRECKVIKSMRRIKGLTQDQASKLCSYSRATIGHIENGRIELSKDRIEHIVISYGYLLKDFEENMSKVELRDEIVDSCLEKITGLDDSKLDIVKNLLGSL
ncbi:MAG: helix-turn-helix transcriptional regulator [Bacteriovoracaceae bacterium]|jgi:transcriptional regulator with XRE-family HTH domain|nr:helix-turn-helix transcriptional regulator [Bacteriovoracaceae bacterium]